MSFELVAERNRTSDHTVKLFEDDGSTSITLAATDVVRFKMYRRDGATPDLDLGSSSDTSNSSGITVEETGTNPVAEVTVRLAQADLKGLDPGVYDAEVAVVDDSESAPADAIKHVEHGIVHLTGAAAGDVGK